MAEQKKTQKEAFVSSEERPNVQIDPETPIADLKVRDLKAILGHYDRPKPFKEWIKEKLEKIEKFEKFEKLEKHEKLEKFEKLEKPEMKDLKIEKFEWEPVKRLPDQFEIPDPRILEQIQDYVRDIGVRVDRLQDQVNTLGNQLG